MCIMRNLSYHVHKEVPGADKYQELDASQTTSTGGSQKKKKDDAGCFGGKKAKGMCCRELRTGNGFGGEFCCVGLLSQAHSSCGFSAVQLAEVRVCGVVARVRLPCSVTTRYLGIFSTVALVLFGFEQEWCMLTGDSVLLAKRGCVCLFSALLCSCIRHISAEPTQHESRARTASPRMSCPCGCRASSRSHLKTR